MAKQTPATFPSNRRLTNASRESYAQHFDRIAAEIDDHTKRLRSSPDYLVPIAAMRAVMSKAGDMLVALLSYGEVIAPDELPPWLRWRAVPETHLLFRGWRGSPILHDFTPTQEVDDVLRAHSANVSVSPNGCLGHNYGSDVTPMHDRLIFIEAVAGWLGKRCEPPPRVNLPKAQAILGPKDADARTGDTFVEVLVDWDGRTIEESALLFMELGPACATVCRHVAAQLRTAKAAPDAPVSSGPASAVVNAYEEAKANWMRHIRFTPEVGHEPARIMVQLGDVEVESYPRMDGSSLLTLLTHPAADQLELDAIALANASYDLGQAFERVLLVGADARGLAAQLRDLPRRPTSEILTLIAKVDATVRNMPIAESEEPQPSNQFHTMAMETIDLATKIVKLRSNKLPEWFSYLHRHTPAEYLAARRQVRNADFVLMYLRHDLAGIASGPMSTRTAHRLQAARARSAEEGRRVEAEVRCEIEAQIAEATVVHERAIAAVAAIEEPQRQWEMRERKAWLDRYMDSLRATFPKFRRMFAARRSDIAAVADTKDIKLGRLGADYGSGCEALQILGIAVLQERLPSEFDGVDPDQIRIAVEREIGHACSERNAAFQAATPTPAEPPNAAPESASPIAVATDLRRDTSELSELDVNKFCRKDDYWEVTFGRQRAILGATVGMACIARLIAKPNTPIDAWMLRYSVPAPSLVQDKIIDDVALANVRQSTGALEQLLVETVDLEVREAAETELKIQRSYLAASTEQRGHHRRPRTVRNDRDRNRESVGKAIADSIRKIGEKLPSLGEHLTATIDSPSGYAPCYKPAGGMAPWVISE